MAKAKIGETKAQGQQIETETQQLQEYWQTRNTQMLLDRDILNLVKPIKKLGEIKWITNEPKVFYETATSLISSYPPRFRLPLTIDFTPEEKDKMNKAERFILGIYRSLDERQRQNSWLRELAYRILSGWYSVFTLVRRNGDGVDFIADIWDPITVYPQWDADGLIKCIRSFEVDKRTARSMVTDWQAKGFPVEYLEPGDEKSKVKVINYWKKETVKGETQIYNALMIGGQLAKPLTLESRFSRIPIFVGAIGVPDQTSDDWPVRHGESIIASNRDMYDYENMLVSLRATITAETAYPNIITKTATGAPAVKAEGLKGYGDVVPIKLNEVVELLKHAATPADVDILMGWVKVKEQKGAIPDIVYGGVPFELSGFAISQLMAAIRYKIAPYLNVMQSVIARIASEFLEQYKNGDGQGKFPKISLSTTNPNQLKKGLFFVEEFKPSDVPDSKFVEVTIPITSAMDKAQQILFARQAMSPPQLLSRETIWDEILDVQDSEQEYTRIIGDQMLEMPIVKQIAMIEQLRERVAFYQTRGKNAEAAALNKYIMMLEVEIGMRPAPATPGAPGVPPSVSPPEAGTVEQSPDVTRSILGVAPPGLSRRAQTPEERAASQAGMPPGGV